MTTSSPSIAPHPSPEVVTCKHLSAQDFGQSWQSHPEFEIMWIISGTVQRRIGDHTRTAQAGDLVLIGHHLPHHYSNATPTSQTPSTVEAISITFKPSQLGPWLQFADAIPLQHLLRASSHGLEVQGATHQHLTSILAKLAASHGIPRLILLLEALNELSSHPADLMTITSPESPHAANPPVQHRLHRITRFIQKHLGDPLYLEDVARHVGMSSVTLSRYLRQHLQKTFPSYLNEFRIARVCRLLRETDATISEIALHCGFDSMANFERQFRKLQGCSPKVYRQRALLQPVTAYSFSSPGRDSSPPSRLEHAQAA